MILADKIVELRKKAGLSQEELAEKVGVSRQAVSKWEGALSTPDMNKILALSEIFGVSTDYLLKDDIESPEKAPTETADQSLGENHEKLFPVDLAMANAFLTNNAKNARQIAFGVFLCIVSSVVLILLETAVAAGVTHLTENLASAIGIVVLLALVAAAVAIFIIRGSRSERFEFLKHKPLDTAYGIDGIVRERRERYAPAHTREMVIGVMLCVLSCVPAVLTGASGNTFAAGCGVAFLLVMVGAGVFLIVKTSTVWSGFQVLLEEGDYTRAVKIRKLKTDAHIGGIYWSIATAIYLAASFLTMRWDITWIIWPVAGAMYGVVGQIIHLRAK